MPDKVLQALEMCDLERVAGGFTIVGYQAAEHILI